MFYLGGPFGDGRIQPLGIQFRDGLPALSGQGDVRGDGDERDARGIGFGHTGNGIERPGAAGTFTDAWFVAQPGIGIRHKRGGAFIPGHDVPDPVPAVVECLIKRNTGISGDTKIWPTP